MRPWIVRSGPGRIVGELHREFRRGEGVTHVSRPSHPFEFVTLERSAPRPGQDREVTIRLDWTYHDVWVKRAADLVGVSGYVHQP